MTGREDGICVSDGVVYYVCLQAKLNTTGAKSVSSSGQQLEESESLTGVVHRSDASSPWKLNMKVSCFRLSFCKFEFIEQHSACRFHARFLALDWSSVLRDSPGRFEGLSFNSQLTVTP